MGEAGRDALRLDFDCAIKLEFHGARVRSDAGLFPYGDLDEAVELTESGATERFDFRTGTNIQHSMTALLRQAGSHGVQRSLRLRLLPPAVYLQPGWRCRAGAAASRQRGQRR